MMDCKEFEKRIPAYIAQELPYAELKKFCEHAKQCAECREELTIQYLTKELNQHEADARRKIRFHDVFLKIGLVLEIAAVSMIFGAVIWILA